MRTQFAIFLGVFLTLYGAIHFYIGLRGWQAFGRPLPPGCVALYWLLLSLLAASFLIGRLGARYLPAAAADSLIVIGSYWLAVLSVLFFIVVAVDLFRLLDRWFPFIPAFFKQRPEVAGLAVVLLTSVIIIYGVWNARNPRLVHYDLVIPKAAGSLEELRVVMVSDIHLGKIVHNDRLQFLVQRINDLNPDLVLLAGDIIDESVGPFAEQEMSVTLRGIQQKYGVFAVFGNHEYIGGHAEEALRHLQEAGVTVLRDATQNVDGKFYIVGRDDQSRARFGETGRQELSSLMKDLDDSLPVILLDHQPTHLEEARVQGVDLQLSGHTHKGQLFPFNLFTRRIFETDWGYLRKGDLQVIVSCGFGTWGPPIRTGSVPEIVEIVIHFTGTSEKEASIPEPAVRILERF